VKDDQWAYCKICVFDIDRNHNKYGQLHSEEKSRRLYACKSVYCNLIISSHVPVAESM
jgi:hypothetical protein